ncbi:MAG TPA: GGDEF domain-containing protein, partial [Spirochaetales bacterium]|nr:GGDEF domain-containing protein [Spirochaetales bacterium]
FLEMAKTELGRAIRYKRPIAMGIMDMDKFKRINDNFGHQAGDKALKLFAHIAGTCLRSCDLLGRIGGDEFAFIFPETDELGAKAAMEKLQARVAQGKLIFDGTEVFLSASSGWASSPGPEHPPLDELFARADKVLYQNKQAN